MKCPSTLFKQIITFIIFSALVGILAQFFLPNGIGLKTVTAKIELGDSETEVPVVLIDPNGNGDSARNIRLDEVIKAFQDETALLLDARSHEEFQTGHIKGAINIPVQAFMDSLTFLEQLEPDSMLITYCDGEDCNVSIDLAADLKMMGFRNVFFFFGGWTEWQAAGLPTETGLR